ncbi:KCNH4 protein, partial [Columbina picui]|nr:KCNH4 protein [Columbina picui]
LSSPARHGSLSSLLGDELCQISALRRNCRSPARCSRSPSPQCRRDARLPERGGGTSRRPPKLLIPSLHANGSPDLSPRVVDGIEDTGGTSEPQAFCFNVDSPLQSTARDSPTSAGTDTSSPALAMEAEEIKQNIRRLNQEINHLNQEVSHLSRELQRMMELLQ